MPYIDYDEIFLKEGEEEISTGRYSDITADGKIDWSIENQWFRENNIQEDMMSKIRIGGRELRFPCRFKDLGEEYAVFDKVVFSSINKTMFPFVISEKSSGTKYDSSLYNEGVYYDLGYLINRNDKILIGVCVDFKTGEIVGLSSSFCLSAQLEFKVDGIGIGNTLNEMYDKLGVPSCTEDTACAYYCENEDYRYLILFNVEEDLDEKVKNNVITDVVISILEFKNK